MTTPDMRSTVHFWSGGQCRDATITDAYPALPGLPEQHHLRVNGTGHDTEVICGHDANRAENTWHEANHTP